MKIRFWAGQNVGVVFNTAVEQTLFYIIESYNPAIPESAAKMNGHQPTARGPDPTRDVNLSIPRPDCAKNELKHSPLQK